MGLLPLEFSDCMLDSPYFRENLKAHEKQLDQTSTDIKAIIKDIQDVLDAAKILSKAKRTLAHSLSTFQFDCLGTSLTDDEVIISNSLREFSKMLSLVEDEMDKVLNGAQEKFIQPLVTFRKDQIGSVRKIKKDFDKQTGKFCAAQDRYVNLGSKKEESLAEAAESVRHEKRNLTSSSLEYVYLMHVVQERKKFEFVEALLSFIQTWSQFYKHGYNTAEKSSTYTEDLKSRVQKTRENYSATIEQYESLKQKMLTGHQDPGLLNRMYTRQGYLYVLNKKNIIGASQWNKHYCQYQSNSRTLTMIPYTQLHGKITTTETINVTSCICKEDSTEKFRFVVSGEETNNPGNVITHTIQAMSEYERKHWVEAMGGTWPAINTLQRIRADSVEENLNSMAFTFLKDCLAELENRGLTDQGLYRVGGVVSKVKKLLNVGLDPQSGDTPLSLNDPKQWESKTIASAVKQYFRDLNKPLMTHQLYTHFIEAIKHETETERLHELQLVILKLPIASREILKVLIRHLSKVASKSETNLMTASNLGVCFGPTLLRPREETVASIMDIKFCNEVIETLIENCDRYFPKVGSSPDDIQKHFRKKSQEESTHQQYIGGGQHNSRKNTPKRELRGSSTPKRTQSFSSFSQLSTNSLPDIKEFKDRAIAALTAARNQSSDKSSKNSVSSYNGHSITLASPSTVKHAILSKLPSPTKVLSRTPSTQDDLMASLEMMNSLAADLPTSSPLKRSHTIQARRGNRHLQQDNQSQVVVVPSVSTSRKPPLPKSSAPSTPTSVPGTPQAFALHQINSSQQCNNHPVPTSVPSHQISSAVQSNYDHLRHHHHHHNNYHHHNQQTYNQSQGDFYDSSSTCSSSNGSSSNKAHSGGSKGEGKSYRAPPPVPNSQQSVPQLLRNNSVPSLPLSSDKRYSESISKLSYDETVNARKNGTIEQDISSMKSSMIRSGKNENYENAYITAATRPMRPTDLFVRQISLSEVQTINGKTVQKAQDSLIDRVRLESSESSSPTTIRSNMHLKDPPPPPPVSNNRNDQDDCETPPPIPTRRYRRIYVNPPSVYTTNFGTKTRNTSGSDATGSIESDMGISKDSRDQASPSNLDSRRRLPHGYASSSSNTTDSSPGMVRANMSMDSGVAVASPSPPTADSGIAISPPIIAKKINRNQLSINESQTSRGNQYSSAKAPLETSNDFSRSSLNPNGQSKEDLSGLKSSKNELTSSKSNGKVEDNVSVTSSSAFSGAGADSDTSVSRYDNVSERKRLSSESLSKTSTLVAAAAAIAAANHTNSSDGVSSSHKFEHVTDGEDEEGGNEAEDEASDFDVSFDEDQCDDEKCCGKDHEDNGDDVSSNASDDSNSSSDALELECSDDEESDCESNCSELMRLKNQEKGEGDKKKFSSSNSLIGEQEDKCESNLVTASNADDFSSPASLTESRPELVAQIDQEIEIRDHYKAVSKRNKSMSSDTVKSSQYRKSGPYENYIPPPSRYVDERNQDGHSFYKKLPMTSSKSPKGMPEISYGKQYIKKETFIDTSIAERKGGGIVRASKNQWEQQDGSEEISKKSTKNGDKREDSDTTDHVNGSSSLSLHAQGLSSIRKLLAAGQTSNV